MCERAALLHVEALELLPVRLVLRMSAHAEVLRCPRFMTW